jgi:hypothetical protein
LSALEEFFENEEFFGVKSLDFGTLGRPRLKTFEKVFSPHLLPVRA